MDKGLYVPALRREASSLAAAGRQGLEPSVPSCPGWTVGDLVLHTGNVHRFVTDVVLARAHDYEAEVKPIRDRHLQERAARGREGELVQSPALITWFEDGAEGLITALSPLDPGEPIWTWFPADQTAGFWQRRMAHETAVHRWDAQLAHDEAEPIGAELAGDGIEEALYVHLPDRRPDSLLLGRGETYHFHRTDGDGEWLVRFGEDEVRVTREHAKADVAARGIASDLMLFFWNRIDRSQLDVAGDAALLDRWFELVPPD